MVMRVIGVIDLKDGMAVHAVRGERQSYRPVRSGLVDGADPVDVARALRDRLGLRELYVADLDAIAGGPGHDETLRALAAEAELMVDAGAGDAAGVERVLSLGVARVIVGTETLADAGAFAELPLDRLVLSLDMRAGEVLARDPELATLGPGEALARLTRAGLREAIVLDLARVGSGEGPDLALVRELHGRFPQLALLAGGGVRDAADLRALARAGAAGALVATALHNGAIGRDDLTG
jgi:phosphoribosylformimino-5-aminoimidazole carboxamide ribotide isomerase